MLREVGSEEPRDEVVLPTILVLDADPAARRQAVRALGALGRGVEAVDLESALLILDDTAPAAVVACIDGDGASAVDHVEAIRLSGYEGPLVVTTARGSLATVVAVMRAGACDVVVKPVAPADLARRVGDLLGPVSAARPVRQPEQGTDADFEGFIGTSPAMRGIYEQVRRIAPSRAPVFITGESGTGKEVTAQAVHRRSGRETGRFVALNCGAIPRELMESEIFGHVRGAFTGAVEDRPGAAELADGGTLFLDEICEMDLALQTKLLRFIQTGEVRRVGDTRTRQVDLRFVCATNRDPQAEVAAGRFREDLFYRLCVLPLHLPPLRQRGDDIPALAEAFLCRFSGEEGRHFRGFEPAAARIVAGFGWPGNVRQLQNVIRRIVVMHDGEQVTAAMLPLALAHGSHAPPDRMASPPADRSSVDPFWVQERRIIEDAIAAFDGNLSRAAAALEISPSTIYRKREGWAREALPKAV
ncbi:sigma-54-dependent transcriptional regulator [Phreatobacter sp.]|uniref:sigma-54-dependent transcriptional regulator n=1 Tax=Phreatobacter sp. TaxID=1966341 RepID=UPI003F70D530